MTQKNIWGSVNNPSEHDPDGFRYLIHGFNPFAQSSMAMVNFQHALSKHQNGEDPTIDPAHGDQTINLYERPEKVAERVSLSMSLIDQDHTGTWGDGGIIIEVPEQNIIATSETDLGSMNSDPAFLKSQFANSARYSGDALMQVTAPTMYNEVVALANVDGSKIALKGFFYKTNRHGEPLNETVARKMQMHASRLGLPIIQVQSPGMYPKDEISRDGNKMAVHFDGCRYLLSGYDDSDFKVFEDKRADFIAPDEMESVLAFLTTQGFDADTIENIRERYQYADQERQRAKVTFSDEGEVEGVKRREGYGKHQVEYVVTSGGYARRVDVEAGMKKFEDSMFGDGMRMQTIGGDTHYSPMSRHQVEQLIAEASEGLDETQRAKVAEWAETILPDVEQKSQQAYGRRYDSFGGGGSLMRFSDFGL